MAQKQFFQTPGTHQNVRNVINDNATDAESRLVNLENGGGPVGADGDSAYQVALNQGFVGTEADWLASLVGADGADGAVGLTGPAGENGEDGSSVSLKGSVADFVSLPIGAIQGDLWVTLDTGDGWVSDGAGGWSNVGQIRGPQGVQGEKGDIGLTGETGATGNIGPQGPQGEKGDIGETGATGSVIISGDFPPLNEGLEGDFFLDRSSYDIYGPKTETGWGSPTSLLGPQGDEGIAGLNGKTILNGEFPPTEFDGNEGDFFLDTFETEIYGPKIGVFWGNPTSLIGPIGQGVPSGGLTGQILVKINEANYNFQWVDNIVKFWYVNKMGNEDEDFSGTGEKSAWVAPAAGKVYGVHSGCSTPTQGGSLTINVKKNGSSIIGSLGVIDGNSDSTLSGTQHVLFINPTSFDAGDRFSFDIESATASGGAVGLHTDLLISWD